MSWFAKVLPALFLALACLGVAGCKKSTSPAGLEESKTAVTETRADTAVKGAEQAGETKGAAGTTATTVKESTEAATASKVELTTSMGKMVIELNAAKAPKSVANFLKYVRSGFYKGTIFHRVIDNFMIQGGGFDAQFNRKQPQAPVPNEADNGLKNELGTVAMARTADPHSASSQFFINTKDNAFLNHTEKTMRGWGYTVFGRVVSGMDTVRKIGKVATGAKGPFGKDAPQTDVVIQSAKIVE